MFQRDCIYIPLALATASAFVAHSPVQKTDPWTKKTGDSCELTGDETRGCAHVRTHAHIEFRALVVGMSRGG